VRFLQDMSDEEEPRARDYIGTPKTVVANATRYDLNDPSATHIAINTSVIPPCVFCVYYAGSKDFRRIEAEDRFRESAFRGGIGGMFIVEKSLADKLFNFIRVINEEPD